MVSRNKVTQGDGLSIHFLEAGTGPDLVFLHGAGGGPAAHDADFIEMLSTSFRVIAPSLPGFDDSDLGGCETVVDVADAVAAFIRSTCTGPVNIAAQSFGTRIACWLSIRHPELVEALVLSAPSALAGLHTPPGTAQQRGRPTPAELEVRLFGREVGLSQEEHARMARNSANAFHFGGPDASELLNRLPEVKARTLVLMGTEDLMLPSGSASTLQKAIPNCILMFLYGAPHELQVAVAERWSDLVCEFFARGEMFVVNGAWSRPQRTEKD
jgi:pimeloyl-ACP methyl ester carboxylesterase